MNMPLPFKKYPPVRLEGIRSAIGKTSIILPCVFMTAVGIGMSALGLLFYVRDAFAASPGIVSIFAATWTFFYAGACIFLRPLSARLLPRYSLIIAAVFMTLALLGVITSPYLPLAFVFYALFGLAVSFFWPPVMGWLSAGAERKSLNRRLSHFNMAWSGGTIISPFLGGALFEVYPLLPTICAMALFSLVAVIIGFASRFLPNIRKDSHREELRVPKKDARDESTPFRFPVWIMLTATYTVLGILINVFPLYARDVLGLSEGRIGAVLLVRALFTTTGFYLLGKTEFWHFKRSWLISNQILLVTICFLFVLTQTVPVFIILYAFFGLIMAQAYSSSVFHGVSGSVQRSKRMAVHETLLTVGMVSGSVLGGVIYDAAGINTAFIFAGTAALVLSGVSFTLAVLFKRK